MIVRVQTFGNKIENTNTYEMEDVNALIIPENVTNREILKAIFPNIDFTERDINGNSVWALLEKVSSDDFYLNTSKKWLDASFEHEDIH